jgi:hypothetical protein
MIPCGVIGGVKLSPTNESAPSDVEGAAIGRRARQLKEAGTLAFKEKNFQVNYIP